MLPSSNIDSTYLGMVGMPPSGESLDQPGRSHERLSRDVDEAHEEAPAARLKQLVGAAHAAGSLESCTCTASVTAPWGRTPL